jgi:retinol dehydrogenase-12
MRVLVTGATDGLGRELVHQLARQGHAVIVHGRSADKVTAVIQELSPTKATVDPVVADLSSVKAVRGLVEEVKLRFPDLDVLVNNAAAWTKERTETADGIETFLAVNHIAVQLLTEGLLPLLSANGAARGTPSRVVTVASGAQYWYPSKEPTENPKVDWSNIQGEKSFDPMHMYSMTKLFNVMMTLEFATRYPVATSHVTFTSMSPGPCDTGLLRNVAPELLAKSRTREQGAGLIAKMAVDPALVTVTGVYYADGEAKESNPIAYDEESRRRLWDVSHQLADGK